MIMFTYQSATIQITANFFLFIGMTLDVIGTATGVISIILVRQYVEHSRSLAVHIHEIHAPTHELTKVAYEAKCHNDTMQIEKLEDLCTQVEHVLKAYAWLSDIHIFIKCQTLLETLDVSSNGGPSMPYFSLIPVLQISLGTLLPLASVLTFQPHLGFKQYG